jgi:hypothetical protein
MKITRSLRLTALASFSVSSNAMAVVVIDNLAGGGTSFATSVTGPLGAVFLAAPPNLSSAFSFVTGSTVNYMTMLEVSVNVSNKSVGMTATLSKGCSVPGGIDPVVLGSVTPATVLPSFQYLTFNTGPNILLAACRT